jgi:hypothetical protein
MCIILMDRVLFINRFVKINQYDQWFVFMMILCLNLTQNSLDLVDKARDKRSFLSTNHTEANLLCMLFHVCGSLPLFSSLCGNF